MASKRGGGEKSNTGLIVALVFFVLATIGLGVGTYMGYSGKADAEKAAKSANDAKTTAEKKAREEQAQRLAVVIAAGAEQGNDRQTFNGLRNEFASSIQAQVRNLKHLTWDVTNQGDKPPKTYDTLVTETTRDSQDAEGKRLAAEKTLAGEREAYAASLKALQAQLLASEAGRRKAQDDVVKEQGAKGVSFQQDQGKIDQLSKDLEKLQLEKENQAVELNREITKLKTKLEEFQKSRAEFNARVGPVLDTLAEVRHQRPELRDVAELHDMLSRQLERVESLANDTPKGEISSIDRTNPSMVYINLGSADYVRPQLTFAVLPAGTTGRAAASRERKAAIEVVQVMEPHLSKAKVIDSQNLIRNPIMRGDLLFNPIWSPSQRLHVAIAGIIDLNSDGRDDTPELVAGLRKQGVEVDAYLDLQTRSIVGPGMTEKTMYLIVGEQPPAPPVDPNDPIMAAANELFGKLNDMKARAKELGLEPVQYRRFLTLVGYKLPKALPSSEYGISSYLRNPSATPAKSDGKDKDKDKEPR
jgi:hypothetical protein